MKTKRTEWHANLPAAAARAMAYYVYIYVDPRTDEVFYVGKGKGNRAFAHLKDKFETEKLERIQAIRAAGVEPRIEILIHGIESQEEAYRVEAAVIDAMGSSRLTNRVRGWKSRLYGRMEIQALAAMYAKEPVDIVHDVIMIRINRTFRFGMTPTELYDATRGAWVIGRRREKAEYALAVFDGVVQEVYRIAGWFPAGTTLAARVHKSEYANRWEFVGNIAEPEVRETYLHRTVDHYHSQGSQNPICYELASERA